MMYPLICVIDLIQYPRIKSMTCRIAWGMEPFPVYIIAFRLLSQYLATLIRLVDAP